MRLENKVAVVTGGAKGLGRGIALRFAKEGAKVAIVDVDKENGQKTAHEVKQIGRDVMYIEADVCKRVQVEDAVSRCENALGGVDVMLCSAGITRPAPFLEYRDEDWNDTLATDVTAHFICTQVVARRWVSQKRGGAIIHVSSVDEIVPRPNNVAYAAAKAGLKAMMESAAAALGPHNIRVTSIGPGYTNEGLAARYRSPADNDLRASMQPLGRLGTAEDVASAAVYLASSEAGWVTGITLYVDGGHLTTRPSYPYR